MNNELVLDDVDDDSFVVVVVGWWGSDVSFLLQLFGIGIFEPLKILRSISQSFNKYSK